MKANWTIAALGLERTPGGGRLRRGLLVALGVVLVWGPTLGVPHMHLTVGHEILGPSSSVAVVHAHAGNAPHTHEPSPSEDAHGSPSPLVFWEAAGRAIVPVLTASGLASATPSAATLIGVKTQVAATVRGHALRPRCAADGGRSPHYSQSSRAAPVSRRGPPASSV